ncbi:MAG TPA: hypothetical protein PL110_17380 [Candidatus Eremiobacteraeota bacterium]|nr:MAG: hypothetical protein BWY64_00801 [bacterium ADurb.Bin363]HPZ09874.1 hypothetical protein [Candidatus Eremiobacteraeota bacterium]
MEKFRYNSEYTGDLIKKAKTILNGEERYILSEPLEQNETAIKIILRKIKLNLKKSDTTEEQQILLTQYMDNIKEYLDILDDLNLFIEDDSVEMEELEEKINKIEELNTTLLEVDMKLQNYTVPTIQLPGLPKKEEDFLPPADLWYEIDKDVLEKLKNSNYPVLKLSALENFFKNKKFSSQGIIRELEKLGFRKEEIENILTYSEKKINAKLHIPKAKETKNEKEQYSSLEILKLTAPPRVRKKLPEEQYENLNSKLKEVGVNLSDSELRKLAESGFEQRINMAVLNKIFNTLEDVIANYGEVFHERVKTILLYVSSNYLFIYDISKFYQDFVDTRYDIMEKIIATLNSGFSITEYLGSIIKIIEISHMEENELMEGTNIITEKLSYIEWIRVNQYEINLRYRIKDLWEEWFRIEEDTDFENNFEMLDNNLEEFLEKLTYLELKIERLPHALESPWELAAWMKELFAAMKEYSLKLQQWTKIKKAEFLSGLFTLIEECFANPNLYTPVKGEGTLLKISRRVDLAQNNIFGFLRQTVDSIINSWETYRFHQPLDYLEQSTLEKALIALTLCQTAIDQIQIFYQNKNMLDLIFSIQMMGIAKDLYTMGLEKKTLPLENENIKSFINNFIGFHIDQVKAEVFLQNIEWLTGLISILSQKNQILNKNAEQLEEINPEKQETSIVKIFIQKALMEFTQGLSDLEMYKTTHMRLFLLTSCYSIIQGGSRLVILKELKEDFDSEDETYKYFNIISDIHDMI